jgi:hypothetical protein
MDSTTNEKSIPSGYLLQQLVQGYQGPLLFCGVFIAEEADDVAEGDRRYHNGLCTDTLGGPFHP